LKASGDTFGEIQDMGVYLDDMVSAYWYDAAATTPIWRTANTSTELVPGLGFYIKMSAASTFPVLYLDSGLGLPSYDLSAGWNLVGSMFGIDRTGSNYAVAATGDTEGEGWLYPVNALDSIQANGSIIVSPSLPGQVATWATTVAHTGTNKMYVGEAYWVFMTADGTLAGLEVTPYYFTWVTAET
jgi:hypothetical protein